MKMQKRKNTGEELLKKVIIFGDGQMAEIAHVYLTHDSPYDIAAFCVDKDFIHRNQFRGLPVVPFESITTTHPPSGYSMFVPIGAKKMNKLRTDKYCQAKLKGYELISYISSKALVSTETKIGENCLILENNVIQPFVTIGNNVVLWSGNHIGHHTKIMDNCFIASHVVISGNVIIQPYCYFGVNATVRDSITIAKNCTIGAGALIMKDTKKNMVFKGKASECESFSSEQANVY
jgi:sugar O-acyltransferase (sialic acid O-acetyltransferase NeuD family)